MAIEQQTPGGESAAAWDFRFATAGLPARDRFEAWRDVSRRLVGVEAASDAPESFDGAFAGMSLGPVTFVRSASRSSWYERTRALADGSDEISLTFLGGGHRIGGAGEEDLAVAAGEAVLFDHGRPFRLAQIEEADTSYHFVIERRALASLLPAGAPAGVRRFAAGTTALALLRGYVPTLAAAPGRLSDAERDAVGRHVADLVALLLGPAPDAAGAIGERGLKAARIKAILDLVAERHARPDLSAAWIGAQLGVSPRQVHRLLEETPKTLREHIIEARLRHAFDLLSDPFGPAASMADIAARCGFARLSHFSHAFRVRFGDTPTGVRAAAAREAAGRLQPTPRRTH